MNRTWEVCEDNYQTFRQYVFRSTRKNFREQEFYYEEQSIAVNTQYYTASYFLVLIYSFLFLLYWPLSLNTLKKAFVDPICSHFLLSENIFPVTSNSTEKSTWVTLSSFLVKFLRLLLIHMLEDRKVSQMYVCSTVYIIHNNISSFFTDLPLFLIRPSPVIILIQ